MSKPTINDLAHHYSEHKRINNHNNGWRSNAFESYKDGYNQAQTDCQEELDKVKARLCEVLAQSICEHEYIPGEYECKNCGKLSGA